MACEGSLNLQGCLTIPDTFEGYSTDLFCIPTHYKGSVDRVLIPAGLIQDRVDKLALDIFSDAKRSGSENGNGIAAVCILKGGYRFFNDLLNKLNTLNTCTEESISIGVDFARIKSYVNDRSSAEMTIIGKGSLDNVRGKNVLIVEDIIDTGKTIQEAVKLVKQHGPNSVKVAALMRKRTPLSNGFVPDYAAFEVPDSFVIGYSADYNEYFRDLAHICIISEAGREKYRV